VEGGGCAVAVAAAAVVAVFEALAFTAMTGRYKELNSDMLGAIVLGGLKSAENNGVFLETGVASNVGQRAVEAYEMIGGPNKPPLRSLIEEFVKLAEGICESAGAEASERKAVAEAIVDNLDLSIPALGGREKFMDISMKMNDAPPYRRASEARQED